MDDKRRSDSNVETHIESDQVSVLDLLSGPTERGEAVGRGGQAGQQASSEGTHCTRRCKNTS